MKRDNHRAAISAHDDRPAESAVRVNPNGRPVRGGWFWRLSDRVARVVALCVDLFYIKPVRRFVPRELFRYVFCGGLNLVIGWLIYYVVFHYLVSGRYLDLGIVVMSPHIQSLFIQFPFTFAIGFWLNKYIAFDYSPLRGKIQLARYVGTVGVSFGIKYFLLKLFVEVLGIFPTVSNVIADFFNAAFSYLMQKYFTFRGRQ